MTVMTRSKILSSASDCVLCDRNATHGEPEDSFEASAKVWMALEQARGSRPLSGLDVALYMAGVKLVRASTNPEHADNWIDLAGYAACGGEIATGGTVFVVDDLVDTADLETVVASKPMASTDTVLPEVERVQPAAPAVAEVDALAQKTETEAEETELSPEPIKPVPAPEPVTATSARFANVWSNEDLRRLLRAVLGEGVQMAVIAERLGRSEKACEMQIARLMGKIPSRPAPDWAAEYIRQVSGPTPAAEAPTLASDRAGQSKPAPVKAPATAVEAKQPAPQPAPAKQPAAASVDTLTMPQKDLLRQLKRLDDSFSPEDDLLLAERLVDGVKPYMVALELEILEEHLQKRWRVMTNAAISIDPQAALNKQRDLLAVLRWRVAVAA